MASTRKPGPADLFGRLRAFLAPRLSPGARLCLGYSGGQDSSVLLHLLSGLRQTLDFSLSAVHVHHGLSANADDWAEFCRATCERLGVPFAVHRVAVVADGRGLEAAAREVRYAVFARQSADFILVAHHADDQAETLLLRLLRGAGVHGLSAMTDDRALVEARLLRPLLGVTQAELAAYARRHGVSHIDDESNADWALSRNWLRGRILPELETRFPACREVLAATASRLSESAGLLDDLARLDLARAARAAGIDLAVLAALDAPRARNMLRYWLRERTGTAPYAAHLEALQEQLLQARPDRQPTWRWGGWVLRRHRGLAELVPEVGPATGQWRWHGEPELVLAEHGRLLFQPTVGEGLAADRLPEEGGVIGWREGGEKLKPDCRRPRRTLKNLLREAGLPPDERLRLPLLSIADQPAWVAGVGVDCAFQAGPGEPGWLISWLPAGRSNP
jgi:tRNA(Ile)-lysidine synthase